MRHIAILIVTLSITLSANAVVYIGFNNIVNPLETPELAPTQSANISVWTDGFLNTPSYYVLGVPTGQPGTLYGAPWSGNPHVLIAPPELQITFPGFSSWVTFSYDGISPFPPGSILVNDITFRCDGQGDVNLQLLETVDFDEWTLDDTQMIYQTPEPGTIALLGLGAMLLKRRR